MTDEIAGLLFNKGADIVRFVDISHLDAAQTQGFSRAVVFCMALSREFIIAARDDSIIEHDEFAEKEHAADAAADWLADYLRQKGYRASSQSEKCNIQNGNFDETSISSRLPHKTIARRAGIGYIGKNNLLINDKYGCAFCMCTVLTDAPVTTEEYPPVSSECGNCDICKKICPENAITGNDWSELTGREGVVDITKCTCTLKCMVNCPVTLRYALQTDQAVF